jgi:hypothetical protein
MKPDHKPINRPVDLSMRRECSRVLCWGQLINLGIPKFKKNGKTCNKGELMSVGKSRAQAIYILGCH